MSGFDKEAERERLREKYEQDREKREATQRMSELLLQGATMTNHHCDRCGDPIFRYDGQEFCPTCQSADGEVASETQAGDETEADAGIEAATEAEAEDAQSAASRATDGAEPAATDQSPAAEANGRATPDAEPERTATDAADAADAPDARPEDTRTGRRPSSQASAENEAGGARGYPPQSQSQPQSRSPPQRHPQTASPAPEAPSTHGDSLSEARDSLSRTLVRYARAAEEADDPRRARDFLAAAREAAEALSALDR